MDYLSLQQASPLTDTTKDEWAQLHVLLEYFPRTGVFIWRVAPRRGIRAGSRAGSRVKRDGYRYIGIKGKIYLEHRLAWKYVTGDWPAHEVDHRNRKRDDNRWKNLREATDIQQRQNQSLGKNNKTGFLGVRLHRCGKYEANIGVGNISKYLGLFDTAEAASRAYKKAKKALHTFNPES